MPRNDIMKWKVNQNSKGWFILEMNGVVTFKEFLSDIINRIGSYGTVYIQYKGESHSLIYRLGVITWVSDEILDRIDDVPVRSGQAYGWHPNISYHIQVG